MTWPTDALIIIDKGAYRGADISGTTATLVDAEDPKSGYYLIDGPKIGHCLHEDILLENTTTWRPCVAVPIGELEFMWNAFMGVELGTNQLKAIQHLSSYLPKVTTDESE
jgi:hypothetical protein